MARALKASGCLLLVMLLGVAIAPSGSVLAAVKRSVNSFEQAITSSVASGSNFISANQGAKACLNKDHASACTTYVEDDGGGGLKLAGRFGATIDPGTTGATTAIYQGTFTVDSSYGHALRVVGTASGEGPVTLTATGINTNINLIPSDAGVVASNGDPIPSVHASQTGTAISIEFGTKTLTTGAGTATFATAFSSTPVCTLGNTSGNAGVQAVPSTSQLVFSNGSGTNAIGWTCIGPK